MELCGKSHLNVVDCRNTCKTDQSRVGNAGGEIDDEPGVGANDLD